MIRGKRVSRYLAVVINVVCVAFVLRPNRFRHAIAVHQHVISETAGHRNRIQNGGGFVSALETWLHDHAERVEFLILSLLNDRSHLWVRRRSL